MRHSRAILTFLIVAIINSAAPADEFPYNGYISGNDVYLRSGPGKNYYPTVMLDRGEQVEIWRHDPGGWYAIRPPEGSFSWVAGKHLKMLKDNVAEVVGDKIVAYVGSSFSDVRDVRQIKLDRGELVEILGEKRFANPKKGVAETWYKIAPPSGEFRWVFGRFVVRRGIPATTASHEEDDSPDQIKLTSNTDGSHDGRSNTGNRFKIVATDDEGVQQASAVTANDDAGESVAIPSDTSGGPSTTSSRVQAPSNAAGSELNDLNLELSMLVAEPPSKWNFDAIRKKADSLLVNDGSALQRGSARLVLREIDRYEKMRKQYADLDQIRISTNRENRLIEIESARTQTQATEPEGKVDLSGFDGVGRLTPVVSKRTGAPQFALTDAQGKVLMFVTPAADVNLRGFVGKRVGLSGTRGYMPQLKKAHLTAKRVEMIDSKVSVASKPES